MGKILKSKVWVHDVNIALPATGAVYSNGQIAMWTLKDRLVNTFGWTVARSSNYLTVADSDLWVDYTNVRFRRLASAASWIVLNRPAGGQMLLGCVSTNDDGHIRYGQLAYSPSVGFSGGTVNALPTAIDEFYVLGPTSVDVLTLTTDSPRVFHMMQSTDGKNFRFVQMVANSTYTSVFVEELDDASVYLDGSTIVHAYGAVNTITAGNLNRTSRSKGRFNSITSEVRLAAEGCSSVLLTEVINTTDLDGGIPQLPIEAVSVQTANMGMLGTVPDMWFGPSAGVSSGDTYPSDTEPQQFAQFGHIILPWNGSVPIIA